MSERPPYKLTDEGPKGEGPKPFKGLANPDKPDDENRKPFKLDPMSLATWARLRSAGLSPIGGKPYGAERMDQNPKTKKKKRKKENGNG